MYPFHLYEVPGDYPLEEDSWAAPDSAAYRWGTVLAASMPRPYVLPADADCGGASFEKGDTLAPGIHIWVETRGGGVAAQARRCRWRNRDDPGFPDSLRAIPGGTITSLHRSWRHWSTTAMHEIGHVLHWYDGGDYAYQSEHHEKTIYYAGGDRAVGVVEYLHKMGCRKVGHDPCPSINWKERFPGGLKGIPPLSKYDGSAAVIVTPDAPVLPED